MNKIRKINIQTILEIFTDYLDHIYFEGFTENLMSDDPERFRAEFQQFKEDYC